MEKTYPHGEFKPSAKHHQNSTGNISKPPVNGQVALNNSFAVDNSPHRISVENGKHIALYKTEEGIYHGFICESWKDVPYPLQESFKKNKLVHPKTGALLKK